MIVPIHSPNISRITVVNLVEAVEKHEDLGRSTSPVYLPA